MNCSIKTKSFNATTTPTISPAQPIDVALEVNARILGIVCVPGAGGVANVAIFASIVGLVDIAMVNINATLAGTNRSWWAGMDGVFKDGVIVQAGPGANTTNGHLPRGMPGKWQEGITQWTLQLFLTTTVDANIVVFYTTDTAVAQGEAP